MSNSYDTFYNVFLAEMPQRMPGSNSFDSQLRVLQENISYRPVVVTVTPSMHKIEFNKQATYWMGDDAATQVSIIVNTHVVDDMYKVVLTSKNPAIPKGQPPFASDVYLAIKKELGSIDLIFRSDNLLSADGENLWKGLVNRGNSISVFDTDTHQYVLTYVTDEKQLDQYLGDQNKSKYVFVLSETLLLSRAMHTTFGLMEIKRLAGWPLFKHVKGKK